MSEWTPPIRVSLVRAMCMRCKFTALATSARMAAEHLNDHVWYIHGKLK